MKESVKCEGLPRRNKEEEPREAKKGEGGGRKLTPHWKAVSTARKSKR